MLLDQPLLLLQVAAGPHVLQSTQGRHCGLPAQAARLPARRHRRAAACPKDARRPGSAGQTMGSLRLKLPLPAEITHQAWAVDNCQYKGLPLRPQPVVCVK